MFKKCIILGMSLLTVSTTYAGAFYDCSADKDGVCKKSSFGFGLTGLYLDAYSQAFPATGGTGNYASFKAPSHWAGGIEGNYYFANNNDVTVNYLHYNFNYNGGSNTDYTTGTYNLNVINAELGQSFDLSPRSTMRLTGGLQYFNLSGATYSDGTTRIGKYNGVGPRVGLNANYKINETFSVFANSAASILLGRSNRSSSTGFSAADVRRFDIATPEVEAKLGISYNRPFRQGMVTVSSGWSVVNYFNLIGDERRNLTLSGPFLEAKWRG